MTGFRDSADSDFRTLRTLNSGASTRPVLLVARLRAPGGRAQASRTAREERVGKWRAAVQPNTDLAGRGSLPTTSLARAAGRELVWDFENPSKRPPWWANISKHIRSLAEYFWTSDGQDLFDVLIDAAERSAASNEAITVV